MPLGVSLPGFLFPLQILHGGFAEDYFRRDVVSFRQSLQTSFDFMIEFNRHRLPARVKFFAKKFRDLLLFIENTRVSETQKPWFIDFR